ncbi:unnamed protein product [Hymenolepis diminuta]|uniref:Transmembrane protein n=1 Tax=Hymenolepis diminuta TaxID=6216 RepID=A0A0R3SK59_HYMDI|nr:unnamed protein product [Hymenolepis diminuta]VUZ53691.1 unnamed protein product [Hymenolepis diminuta]
MPPAASTSNEIDIPRSRSVLDKEDLQLHYYFLQILHVLANFYVFLASICFVTFGSYITAYVDEVNFSLGFSVPTILLGFAYLTALILGYFAASRQDKLLFYVFAGILSALSVLQIALGAVCVGVEIEFSGIIITSTVYQIGAIVSAILLAMRPEISA